MHLFVGWSVIAASEETRFIASPTDSSRLHSPDSPRLCETRYYSDVLFAIWYLILQSGNRNKRWFNLYPDHIVEQRKKHIL